MDPILILAVVICFTIAQISIFRALPGCIRRYLAYWTLLSVGMNFMGSFTILFFTGTRYFAGPMNLISSVMFGAYLYGYKKYRSIGVEKRGFLKFPHLVEGSKGNILF